MAVLDWLTERRCVQFKHKLDNGYERGEARDEESEEENEAEVAR